MFETINSYGKPVVINTNYIKKVKSNPNSGEEFGQHYEYNTSIYMIDGSVENVRDNYETIKCKINKFLNTDKVRYSGSLSNLEYILKNCLNEEVPKQTENEPTEKRYIGLNVSDGSNHTDPNAMIYTDCTNEEWKMAVKMVQDSNADWNLYDITEFVRNTFNRTCDIIDYKDIWDVR